MNLFEYIKSQLPKMPNASIMKNMGASDELIEYIRETPWNTNLSIIKSINENETIETWFITVEQLGSVPQGTYPISSQEVLNYPIGRYEFNEDHFSYIGEPTGEVGYNANSKVEIYIQNDVLKARARGNDYYDGQYEFSECLIDLENKIVTVHVFDAV